MSVVWLVVLLFFAGLARAQDPPQTTDESSRSWIRRSASWSARTSSARRRDDKTFPVFANPASVARSARAWAVGLNWYLNKNLRVMLDYERTKFDGGAATGDREDENILFSRFQIAF